ncbi:MAG: hypothetical protein MI810_09945 [Flavobacteriales bacterium]|nr:hypothetical protein [Flavobacteriales bacterium]
MHGLENIYYAMGEMAYAIAKADGTVQKEERQKIQEIVLEQTKQHNIDFDFAETIFLILEKDDPDAETSYEWAMQEFDENKIHLTPQLVNQFIVIADRIADAFDLPSKKEDDMVARFKIDIQALIA